MCPVKVDSIIKLYPSALYGRFTMNDKPKRGFAAMTKEERSRISSMGGKEAHRRGTAHEWDSEKAKIAGRKGAAASVVSRFGK